MQTTQQITRLAVLEIYDLEEFRNILECKLYIPDMDVREKVILELLSYLGEKLKDPNYKIKIFALYNDLTFVTGHIGVIISIALAAAEAAVGLGIILSIFRTHGTIDATDFVELKG